MINRKRRKSSDPYLSGKVGLFFLAAGVWLAGVIADLPWLTGAAILLLGLALVLRLLSSDREPTEEPPGAEDSAG